MVRRKKEFGFLFFFFLGGSNHVNHDILLGFYAPEQNMACQSKITFILDLGGAVCKQLTRKIEI